MKIYREITPITSKDVFGFFDYPDGGFDYPMHRHPEFEITLIFNGSGNRVVGDKVEKYHNSDLVLLGPNLSHRWDNSDTDKQKFPQTHVTTIFFEKKFLDNPLLDKEVLYPIKKMLEHSVRGIAFTGEVKEKAKQCMLAMVEMEGFRKVVAFFNLLDILANSEEMRLIASAGYSVEPETQEGLRMDKVYNFVHQNYKRKLMASEVADLVNLSESAFSHFFRKSANRSFSQYLTETRIGQACKLLFETQYSIREICYQCGYTNLSNFNRLFKKYKGMTPLEYRKQVDFSVSEVADQFVAI